MKNDTYLYILFVLIMFDFISTFIGILYMGAIEINPLYKYFNNMEQWFIFKFTIGMICLSILAYVDGEKNRYVIKYGLMTLICIYGMVAINNSIQIINNW